MLLYRLQRCDSSRGDISTGRYYESLENAIRNLDILDTRMVPQAAPGQ